VTDVKDILSEYQAFAGNKLLITWEDPAKDEDAKEAARSLNIPEIQMQTFEKDKAQVINGYLGIGIMFENKNEAIPVVQNLQNLEYDLTMAIMKVARSSAPKVGILKTDTMPYIPPNLRQQMQMTDQTEDNFAPLYEKLKTNYDVSTVDVSDGTPIDSTIKTLIIPGGSKFSDRKLFEIDQFFMKDGNLIVLADAVKVDFQYGVNGSVQESKILDLLEHYGVRVERNMILDHSCGQVSIPQNYGPFSMNVPMPYPYFVKITPNGFDKDNPAVAPLSEVILPWASSLTVLADSSGASAQTGVKANILATSSEKSWTANGQFNLNPQQQWTSPPEEQMKEHPMAAHLSGSFNSFFSGKSVPPVKEPVENDSLNQIQMKPNTGDANRMIVPANTAGHLVVVGDADFVSKQNAAPMNVVFVLNVVDWLTLDKNLISVRTRSIKDRSIETDQLKEGSSKTNIIRYLNILSMPLLIIVIGLVIFLRRRERIAVPISSVPTEGKSDEKK